MRILVVEDEFDLAMALRRSLEEDGYAVDVAHDGESGLFQARHCDYDAILLDLMLPELSGQELLARLRRSKKTPVLVLTARDAVGDRVEALDSGADDYLVKPFDLRELLSRVRALIRRSAGHADCQVRVGELELDTRSRTVRRSGHAIALSPKEYAIAEYLLMHRGQLITRTMLYDHVYDDQNDTLSNVLDVYVASLRRKLGRSFVRTRRGAGYIVEDSASP